MIDKSKLFFIEIISQFSFLIIIIYEKITQKSIENFIDNIVEKKITFDV